MMRGIEFGAWTRNRASAAEQVEIEGSSQAVELSARLFDFGVLSLRATLGLETPRPWAEWTSSAAQVTAGDWNPHFRQWKDRLISRLAAAIVKPEDSGVTEDYTVFQVHRLLDPEGRPFPLEWLTDDLVAGLLFGEGRPLSGSARRELLSQRYSYFEDDLTILTWNAALVVEPVVEDTDVPYILEFANAQLVELRYYDTVLDRELPRLHGDIAAGRRYGRLLAALQSRVTDTTDVVERVENSLKVTEDVYLARIYAAALEIFRGPTWRRGIDRKVAIVREAYSMLNDESEGRRAEVLELTIILLIALEIVVALRR